VTGRLLSLLALYFLLPFAAAEEKLTLEDLKFLLETEKDQRRIVTLVRRADRVVVETGDLEELKRLGATGPLLEALREQIGSGSSLTVRTVLRMLREKEPMAEIIDHIVGAGPGLTLTARQKLDLRRAGATADVVRALEGRYVYPGFTRHTADHGMFSIQHPGAWKSFGFYGKSGPHVVLSPQDVDRPGDFTVGIDVQTIGHYPTKRSLLEQHRRNLPALLAVNHEYDLEPAGEAGAVQVDGLAAVEQRLHGTFRGERCSILLVRVVDQDVEFFIQLIAPLERADDFEPILRRALRTFRTFPGQPRLFRLRQPLDPTEAIERFRESVVHVRALFGDATGSGSGFIAREDGYVLTNHHVVCRKPSHHDCTDPSRMKLAPRFELVWDSRVGPKAEGEKNRRAPATLVGTVYQREPFIDLALLKLPRAKTPYRALPLCRAGRNGPSGLVKDGDPVLAMGFPLPGRFGVDFLTPTQGALTRVDYRRESGNALVLDRIRATVNIQKGNSGGPLVSLATGGVVGLNTAAEAAVKGETRVVGERLGHQIISPIDWALHHFPQLRYYPLHRDPPLEAHVELAEMLLRSNLDAAKVELDYVAARAGRLEPKHRADYHYLRHLYAVETNDRGAVLRELDNALKYEPRSFRVLVERVRHTLNMNEAIGFADRAVAVQPESPWGYYHRAAALRRANRLDEALKDVARAKNNGGANQPAVWQLEGLIRFDRDELDAALKAYRESLRLDPNDPEGRFGVAGYYVRKNDHANAERAFERLARDFPEHAPVFSSYAGYLADRPGRKRDALAKYERAIELSLEKGAKPAIRTLRRTSALANELGTSYAGRAVRAAVLLSRHWPSQRRGAHTQLGRAWEKAQRPALAYAHFRAADPRGSTADARRVERRPLPLADVDAAVRAQYDPGLFTDALKQTDLGFSWSKDLVKQLVAKKWQLWQILALRSRFTSGSSSSSSSGKEDRPKTGPVPLEPSTALGGKVSVSYEGTVDTKGSYSPSSTVVFTNRNSRPVMDLRVKIDVLRKSGGKRTVLGSKTRSVHTVLQPGQAYKMRFAWIPWAEMRKLGIDRTKITHYACSVVAATDATILKQVEVTGGYRKDKSAYDYKVTNTSGTPLRSVQIRCDFVDGNGNPIPGHHGLPAHLWAFPPGTIRPGASVSGSNKSWASWPAIRRLGVKAKTVNVRLVVAHAEPVTRSKPNRPRPVSLAPTAALGRAVKVSYEGTVDAKGSYSPVSKVIFTNTGKTPVMNLQVKIEIIRKAGGKRTVLGGKTRAVHVVLQPGGKYRMRFAWIPWAEMKKLGIDRKKITHYACSVVAAADATILKQVEVKGGYRKDKSAYDFKVTNNSGTPLRSVQVRCDFVDKQGRPIARDDGTPAHMWAFIPGVLRPGQTYSGSNKQWASWPAIRAMGVKEKTVNALPVVAHAVAATPTRR